MRRNYCHGSGGADPTRPQSDLGQGRVRGERRDCALRRLRVVRSCRFPFSRRSSTSEGVTYTTWSNLLVGPLQGCYPVTSNVFNYNGWTPVTANVSSSPDQFNLLGFDVGLLDRIDPVDIRVTTNVTTYVSSESAA